MPEARGQFWPAVPQPQRSGGLAMQIRAAHGNRGYPQRLMVSSPQEKRKPCEIRRRSAKEGTTHESTVHSNGGGAAAGTSGNSVGDAMSVKCNLLGEPHK